MNIGDIYNNTCNDQPSTWTVTHFEGNKVTVYSLQSDRSYTISQVIFEDTMRALGFQLQDDKPSKYRIYYPNLNAFHPAHYDSVSLALIAGQLNGRMDFRVELGDMVCLTWSLIEGAKWTEEYKSWYTSQQIGLAKVEGSYP